VSQHRQRGASLLEVMVAFSVLTIALVGVMFFYQHAARAKQAVRLQAVQEALAQNIASKLQSPSSLYLSLLDTNNADFIRCVIGTETGCTETLTKPPVGEAGKNFFTLHYQTSTVTSLPLSSINYTSQGVPGCTPDMPTCLFQAKTFFYGVCPPVGTDALVHPPSCLQGAQEVYVGYTVQQIQPSPNGGGAFLPPLPRVAQMYPISVLKIMGTYANASCNPGATASGYSPDGVLTCKCSLPYIPSTDLAPNRRGTLCALLAPPNFSCPVTLIYHGLDANGKPICKTFEDSYECQTVSGDQFTASGGTCGDEYWMEMYTRGTCTFYCAVTQGGGACSSLETTGGDARDQGMYVNQTLDTSGWGISMIQTVQGMAKPGAAIYPSSSVTAEVKQGMICTNGKLSCCKQKE